MNMSDFIIMLSGILFGFVMGQIFFALKIRNAIRKIAESHGIDIQELQSDIMEVDKMKVFKIPNLFTESTNNSILLYNKDTGDFVAQAETMQELAENIYKFNKIHFAFVKHEENQVWFVEGKIRDDLKEI